MKSIKFLKVSSLLGLLINQCQHGQVWLYKQNCVLLSHKFDEFFLYPVLQTQSYDPMESWHVESGMPGMERFVTSILMNV
jgi:hypothetical protein